MTASIAGVVRRAGGTAVDRGVVHLLRAGEFLLMEPLRVGGGFAFFDAPADLGLVSAIRVRADDGAEATFTVGGDPPLPADWARRQDLVLVLPPPVEPKYITVLWKDGSPAADFYFFTLSAERPTGDGSRIGSDGRVRLPQRPTGEPWTHYGVAWSARAKREQFVALAPAAEAGDGVLRLDLPPPSTRRAVAVLRDGSRWTSARLAVRVGDQVNPVVPERDGSFTVRLLPPDVPYEVLSLTLAGAPESLRRLGPDEHGVDVWQWTRAPVSTATLEFLQAAPPERPWTRFRGTLGTLSLQVDADRPLAPVALAEGVHRMEGEWDFGDAPSWRATTEVRISGEVGQVVAVRPPHGVAPAGSARVRLARVRLTYPDGRVPPVVDVSRADPDDGVRAGAVFPRWHDERVTDPRHGFDEPTRSKATADGEHRFWLRDDGKPFVLFLDGMAAQQMFGPFSAPASGDFTATLRFDRFARPALRLIDQDGGPVGGRTFVVRNVGLALPGTSQESTAGGYVMAPYGGAVNVFLVSDAVSDGIPVRMFERVASGLRAKDDSTSLDVVVRPELLLDRETKSGSR